MSWILEGRIEAPSRLRDRGGVAENQDIPPALRSRVTQVLSGATIGAHALEWEHREYVEGRRTVDFRARFDGVLTPQEFMQWVRELFEDDPVRGIVEIRSERSGEEWYCCEVGLSGVRWTEWPPPREPIRALNESRSGW